MNKSEQIRLLHDRGFSVSEISRKLGIRYQFAYNVVRHHKAQKRLMKQEPQSEVAAAGKSIWSAFKELLIGS